MKIGFDISQTGPFKAGCGYVAYSLADRLANTAEPDLAVDAYTSFGDQFFDPELVGKTPVTGPRMRYFPFDHRTREDAAVFWNAADLSVRLGRPDIVHCNNFWCPDRRQTAGTTIVYTLYDLSFMIHPEWTTEANRLVCLSGMIRAALNADWIVAISEASRRDFLNHFPAFADDRVRVIYPASRFADSPPAPHRPAALGSIADRGFWLSVGTLEPRKNHITLAQAYARYRRESANSLPLVLAGGTGWMMDDFRRDLAALDIADAVHFTGYVSDEELAWLYRRCVANLYTSHFEGFGLPVLEGMTFGAATVSSNASSLPEVCGDAGLLLPPTDVDGWAATMLSLEREPNRLAALRAAAGTRAEAFKWENSARQLVTLYREARGQP